jgi:UDP-N-acetyl-D-mannosaminuronic acid dehydrogenase
VDPWFFVEAAPDLTPLIYRARAVNDSQPHFVVEKTKQALGGLKGRKIAALGLAYKPDVDDLRESPATEVIHLLQKEGAQVRAWEPFKPAATLPGIQMAPSLDQALGDAEALILLVGHTEFRNLNPAEIMRKTRARILIDTVNGWQGGLWRNAGFDVHVLGVGTPRGE